MSTFSSAISMGEKQKLNFELMELKRIPHKYGEKQKLNFELMELKRIPHKYGHICVGFFFNSFPKLAPAMRPLRLLTMIFNTKRS